MTTLLLYLAYSYSVSFALSTLHITGGLAGVQVNVVPVLCTYILLAASLGLRSTQSLFVVAT